MGHWAETAANVIARVHSSLPDDATLADRKTAIDDAYPFGIRKYSPYKTWLRHRRLYLAKYGYGQDHKPLSGGLFDQSSPLDTRVPPDSD